MELRKKKADYDDTIEKLQRQAYLQLVKMEQERAAVERMREDEARKKKREETQRIKRFLEAAFDGDNDEIQMILDEVHNCYSSIACLFTRLQIFMQKLENLRSSVFNTKWLNALTQIATQLCLKHLLEVFLIVFIVECNKFFHNKDTLSQ